MSSRKRLLTVAVVALALAGAAVGLAISIDDERVEPVPTTFRGAACQTYGERLLVCPREVTWVRADTGRPWRRVSFCRPVEPGVQECERPFLLRIDSSGEHPKLEEPDA